MPIVTHQAQPKPRRAHRWLPALGLAALLPVGIFLASWFRPLGFDIGSHRFIFGASYGPTSSLGPGWHWLPNGWQLIIVLPGRTGLYDVTWIEPMSSTW